MALIFNEQFEAAPGYDETSAGVGSDWVETNTGGGIIDEDYLVTDVQTATGLSLPYWGTQCMKMANGTASCRIGQTFDSGYTECYMRFDLIIGDIAALANELTCSVFYTTAGAINCITIYTWKDSSGNLKLRGVIENSGGNIYVPASPYYAAAINTKYRIDIHFISNGTCEIKINGVSQGTGTCDTAAGLNKMYLYSGRNEDATYVMYYDNIQVATDGWIPDDDPHKGVTMRFIQSYIPPV